MLVGRLKFGAESCNSKALVERSVSLAASQWPLPYEHTNLFSSMLKAFQWVKRCIATVTSETCPQPWCLMCFMGERKSKHPQPTALPAWRHLVKWIDHVNCLWNSIKLMDQTALWDLWELALVKAKESVSSFSELRWIMSHRLGVNLLWQQLCMCIGDEFVRKLLQTYLTSRLQLVISGQRPSLVFADSLGLFICQLVSPFARFPVVNSSCLLCQTERQQKKLLPVSKAKREMIVSTFVVTLSVATTVICIQATLLNTQLKD